MCIRDCEEGGMEPPILLLFFPLVYFSSDVPMCVPDEFLEIKVEPFCGRKMESD